MTMRRRRSKRVPELTPLIDVLFILLFASLIHARSAVESAHSVAAGEFMAAADAGVDASVDAGMDAGPDAGMDAGPDAGVDAGNPTEAVHLVQSRELASQMANSIENQDVYLVEVTGRGYITAMARWSNGQLSRRDRVEYRLVRAVLPGESNIELEYLGARDPAFSVCNIVHRHYAMPGDPTSESVIITIVDVPLDDLSLAMFDGLRHDLSQCFVQVRGIGILFQPGDDFHGFQ